MTLEEIRKTAGLSREKAARSLDCSPNMLYRWETGRTMPTVPYVVKMAELYGVPLEEIAAAVS